MSKAETLKSIVKKNVGEKPTFGTDPKDPWSAKANIAEDAALDQYLISRGINPKHVTKDQKVAHSKMGQFIKWKRDHMSEAVDKKDTITFDIPLLIRVLEFAREDLKSDILLHKMVERLLNIRGKGTLTMNEYGRIIKEEVEALGETYYGPRGDKLLAVSHAAYHAGEKEKSSRAHKLAMRAGEKYRSNPENREKAIRHIMSGASKDYGTGKRWTGDSVEHPEDTNVISEISSETLQNYKDKAKKSAEDLASKGEYKKSNDRLLNHMKATGKQIQKTTASIKKSLNVEDCGCDVPPQDQNKKLIQMSKSARIIKSIYKKKGVKEEIGGKKPKVQQIGGSEEPKAAAILSGGTTMTGEKRDTIEIDPMMKKGNPFKR